MKFSSYIWIIIMYYIMYEEAYILYTDAAKISMNTNNNNNRIFLNNGIGLLNSNNNKYLNYFNNYPFNRKRRGVETNKILKINNFNQKNISDRNKYRDNVNCLKENKLYKSYFPEKSNLVSNLNNFNVSIPLLNKFPQNIQNQHDLIKSDLSGLNSYKNFDANLYGIRKDASNYYEHNNGIDTIPNAEEITDKSSFYEANLYVNSLKKPTQNVITRNDLKKTEDSYLNKYELQNNDEHSRIYRSKNIENTSQDENKNSQSEGIFNQDITLIGSNQQDKTSNFINEDNSLQNKNYQSENSFTNFNPKLLQSDSPFQSDNDLKKNTTANTSNLLISTKNISSQELSPILVKNPDQLQNYTNDFTSQNSENLTNGNTIDLTNKYNYTSDNRQPLKDSNSYNRKMNADDVKNENYDNYFQQLQENLTKMNLLKPIHPFNTFPDYDHNKYHTGSIRPQLVLHDDRPANINFRNLIGDNITWQQDNNELLEYLANDKKRKRNRISKYHYGDREINNVTNSSGNFCMPFLSVNNEKISFSDVIKLTGSAGGGGCHPENKLGGFLSQPPANTKVNIKDPKLIQNLRKIDISLLSFPPAFNYGLPITKPKKMPNFQRINKRSYPMITLQLTNQSAIDNVNKLKNLSLTESDFYEFPANIAAELLPGIVVQPEQLDKDTIFKKPAQNNLYNLTAFLNPNNKRNENDSFPKYLAINSTSSNIDPTNFQMKELLNNLASSPSNTGNQVNIFKNWNNLPESLRQLSNFPNLTQELNNDNKIKNIDLERSLKQLRNCSSKDSFNNLQELTTLLVPKLHSRYDDEKKDDLTQSNKVKLKYFKTDETVDNIAEYSNKTPSAAYMTTENTEKKLVTYTEELKQPLFEESRYSKTTSNITNKGNSNTSLDTRNKNKISHIKLLGFVIEKNNPEKLNNHHESNNNQSSSSNENYKLVSTFEPIKNEINDKFVSNLVKPSGYTNNLKTKTIYSVPSYQNISSVNDLTNFLDPKLLQKLLSIMQRNISTHAESKFINR